MIEQLLKSKIVAVIRADSPELAINYTNAIINGGITAIELTYTIPDVINVITNVKNNQPNCLLGIGSVLTAKQAQDAVEAGAMFVVSPGYIEEVQSYCDQQNIIYIPGAMTVSEIIHSMNRGNKITKLFPGSEFGPNYLKSLQAPIPNLQVMVTGGVDLNNITDWFDAGASLVGVGGQLTKSNDFEQITNLAHQYKKLVKL